MIEIVVTPRAAISGKSVEIINQCKLLMYGAHPALMLRFVTCLSVLGVIKRALRSHPIGVFERFGDRSLCLSALARCQNARLLLL